MRSLVVLPSYNEASNITALIESLLAQTPDLSVCVVDDSSPDGTAGVVQKFIESLGVPRVHLLVRATKDGRGGAVRDGFKWGLNQSQRFEAFVEMDCDFSHPPTDIVKGLKLLANSDLVMGSRYPNGTIVGWPVQRRVFSYFANMLARTLIDWSIADYTNGFRFYNRKAVEFLVSKEQQNKGYIYLSESLAALLKAGFKVTSFPIVFVNRQRGASNTSLREVTSALKGIFTIARQFRTPS